MIPTNPKARRFLTLFASIALASAHAPAQTAPVDAATLAKYDTNKNGMLDPTELAAQSADQAKSPEGALLMNPFEVNTAKDRGYAAGNTLSGGRADTPLAITSASISVMTKEFLDDFAITDMNEAAQWTVGMDPPTGGDNGPFGGNRFQANFRGAGNGANYPSRNGALQYFVADSYNSERFEFSRGPNAALFGDAGPGGMQGSSSKRARFNDRRGSVTFRGDSYDGYRATIDASFGFDRVALRVNALRQDTKAIQDGTSNKENAISLAASFKIAPKTQLRAEYERTAEWQVQYRRTYNENASLWDRVTVNNDNTTIANPASFGIGQINGGQDVLTYNLSTNSLLNYRGNQYRTVGLGYAIPWEGRADIPNFKPNFGKTFNLGPADAYFDRDLNNKGIYLEHQVTSTMFLELAWLHHDIDPVQLYVTGAPNDYRLDLNRLLPTGATNPNFGKAYADFGQGSQYQQNGVTEYRFILSDSFRVPKWFDMNQRISLNGGWRQDLYEAWSRAWRRVDNPTVVSPQNGANQLNFRVYYDQPRARIAPILDPAVMANLGGMRWANVDTGFAADNDRRLTYAQVVSQTSFFQERLGITLSVRRDKNEDDTLSNIGFNTAAPYDVIMGTRGVAGAHGILTTWQTSKNGGFVAYPFPARMKWLAPLGVMANYSQNFSVPSTGGPLISGERPTPPVATTKDWGIRYSIPNGVAYATLTHYNTEQVGNIQNFGSQGDFVSIWTNLGYTDPLLTTNAGFTYRDTNDRKLEGWEFEITANPTRNLTLVANYSHPIVTTISDSPGRRAYYAANLAQFQAGAAATAGQVIGGRTILDPQAIANALQNIDNSFNGFTPGTLANNLERHRASLASSYRFTEGALRGFGVSAGVVYRGHRKVGSRDAIIKFGLNRAPTVNENAQAAYDYLWVDPTWSTTAGVNYTRRFGKYTARFQLNVANLLNDDEPQWSSYSTINAGQLNRNSTTNVLTVPGGNNRMQVLSGFNQLDPRKFTFTTTLSF
ncbi:MAG: TonB-dependent receptor plug domain-containing protein [Opitutaceae bacterium]